MAACDPSGAAEAASYELPLDAIPADPEKVQAEPVTVVWKVPAVRAGASNPVSPSETVISTRFSNASATVRAARETRSREIECVRLERARTRQQDGTDRHG